MSLVMLPVILSVILLWTLPVFIVYGIIAIVVRLN